MFFFFLEIIMFEKNFLDPHFLENQTSGEHSQSSLELPVLTGNIPQSARKRGFFFTVDSSYTKSHDFFFRRLAKIAVNQDGEDKLVEAAIVAVVVAAEGSRVETLGSDSNFSDLDLNRFENNENLPFFFQYDPL